MDGRHRLWVASRVTVTRLGVGRVGRVSTCQDRWLPVAPRRWRARVQGVAVLIGRRGSGIGHGHSRAEGKPQFLGPAIGNKQAVMSSWSLTPPLLPYRLCLWSHMPLTAHRPLPHWASPWVFYSLTAAFILPCPACSPATVKWEWGLVRHPASLLSIRTTDENGPTGELPVLL